VGPGCAGGSAAYAEALAARVANRTTEEIAAFRIFVPAMLFGVLNARTESRFRLKPEDRIRGELKLRKVARYPLAKRGRLLNFSIGSAKEPRRLPSGLLKHLMGA